MSIIHIDSLDTYGADSDLTRRWNDPGGNVGSNIHVESGGGRFGGDALRFSSEANLVADGPDTHGIVGFWFKMPGSISTGRIVSFDTETGSTDDHWLGIGSGGELERRDSLGTSFSTGYFLDADEWYFLEFELDDGSNNIRYYVNGQEVASESTGEAINGVVVFRGAGSGHLIDDIYVIDADDGQGAVTPLGPVRMGVQTPNADTTDADFTPQGGGDNHDEVDENPPDGDTTYVESGTVGHRDRYGLSAMPFTPESILAAQVVPVGKDAAGGGGSIKALIEHGSSESAGPSIALPSSYGDDALAVFEINPSTGSAWSQSELEAATAGMEVT